MKIFLDEQYYQLAKSVNYSELGNSIVFHDTEKSIELSDQEIAIRDYFGQEIKESPIEVMLDCISDEIVATGLADNQETVLPRGRDLYDLYDSIFYNLQE